MAMIGAARGAGGARDILFGDLTERDWQRILPMVQRLRFEPGTLLVEQGADDAAFYILTEGSVAVLAGASPETEISRIEAPSVFGEVAFFDAAPRSASVRALTEGSAIRVTRDAFLALSDWEPRIAQSMLMDLGRALAGRLRETTQSALR